MPRTPREELVEEVMETQVPEEEPQVEPVPEPPAPVVDQAEAPSLDVESRYQAHLAKVRTGGK